MYDDILYDSNADDEDYDSDNSVTTTIVIDNSIKISKYESMIADKLMNESRLSIIDKKLATSKILKDSIEKKEREILSHKWLIIHLENNETQFKLYKMIDRFYWLKIEQVREKNPLPIWKLRRAFRDISRMSTKIFQNTGKQEFLIFSQWVQNLDSLVKLSSQVCDERFVNRILENEYTQPFTDRDDYSIMPVNKNVTVTFRKAKRLDAATHNEVFAKSIDLGLIDKK